MSNAYLWPYSKCVKCARKSECADSQAQIISCMGNDYPDFKPQTNADRIRAMTDEELADELLTAFAAFYDVEWSKEAVLDWLKQEATDGTRDEHRH